MFEIFAAAVGLCFGSFANVVIRRWPNGKSIVSPLSHCPSCNTFLKWRDMMPVISWLILRGQCRYCKAAISKRYIIIEAICAVLFTLMARHTGFTLSVLPLWGLAFVLVCVSVVDWETMQIPDELLVLGAVSGIAWMGLFSYSPQWQDAILGAVAGALPLLLLDRFVWMLAKKPGFGFGDVKLMAVAGLFLGWQGMWTAYFVAFVAGGFYGMVLIFTGRAERGSYLAFGPFLCLGVLVALLR